MGSNREYKITCKTTANIYKSFASQLYIYDKHLSFMITEIAEVSLGMHMSVDPGRDWQGSESLLERCYINHIVGIVITMS